MLLLFLAFVAAQRIVELVVSARNERRLRALGGTRVARDGFGLILFVHAAFYALVPLEILSAPWAGVGAWTWPAAAVALIAMGVRYWAASALGVHYTVRVVHVPGAASVTSGPYRWIRHPIYAAVAVEVFALPAVFGAWATAVALGTLNLIALQRRIRFEEPGLASSLEAQRDHARPQGLVEPPRLDGPLRTGATDLLDDLK